MQYWLIKSEPGTYSWQDFVQDQGTFWDGVRNYAARNNLQAMQKGDLAFFYHSNQDKAIMGIAEVTRTAYPDPTTEDKRWMAVDVRPIQEMPQPVSLQAIKAEEDLQDMDLVRLSRLSVGKVSKAAFQKIRKMGGF